MPFKDPEKRREYVRKWKKTPKGQESIKRWGNSQNRKEYSKEYFASPEGRAAHKKAMKKYNKSPKGRKSMRKYRSTPKYKEVSKRYSNLPKVKEVRKKYSKSPKGIELKKQYTISPQGKKVARRTNLRINYNMTLDAYDKLLTAQCGLCAVCAAPHQDNKKLHIDHDHRCCSGTKSCGKCVRGLLCRKCNALLGFSNDSPAILRKAADYIERHIK